MSSLTRTTLAASVLAAVRGKKKSNRMEDEKPEAEDEVVDDDQTTEEDAEGDKPDPEAEGDDKEPAAEDDPTDPDAEDDDQTKPSAASVRRAEQSRIKSILMHPMADANPALAAELAFGAKCYSTKDAGALLTSAAAGGGRLADRMQGRSPKLGSGSPAKPSTEKQTVLSNMGAAIKAMHGRNGKGA